MYKYYVLHIFEIDYTKSIVCKSIKALCNAIYENKSYLDENDFYIETKCLSCDLIKKLGYFLWSDKYE